MATFTLDTDEFAAMVGFLNAKSLVGMDEALFASFTEENLPRIMNKLRDHGWMQAADRPNTWHTNEDLFQTLTIAVAPHFAILGRSKAHQKSILFYVADDDFVQIVVTNEQVVVTNIADEYTLGACLVTFFDAALPAEIVVAHVHGDTFDEGRVAVVDEHGTMRSSIRKLGPEVESPWNEDSIAEFVRDAMAELVRT